MRYAPLILLPFLLAGCQTIGALPSVNVSPRSAQLAVSSFDAAEVAATGYMRLPLCGSSPCRTPSASARVIAAVHDGRKARALIEGWLRQSKGGPVPVSLCNALQGAVAIVQSIAGN